MPELPPNSVLAENRADWRAWLEEYYARPEGVWLITYKKASGKPHLGYAESVEEALCFGWIDSKSLKLDDERSMLWFSPRKAGSGWSKVNKERLERLIADGQMAPAGVAKIEAAQRDGSWEALDAVEMLTMPADLTAALEAAGADAMRYFDAFPRSAKRAILVWVTSAKKPETRARRVEETARLAAENRRANQ